MILLPFMTALLLPLLKYAISIFLLESLLSQILHYLVGMNMLNRKEKQLYSGTVFGSVMVLHIMELLLTLKELDLSIIMLYVTLKLIKTLTVISIWLMIYQITSPEISGQK